MVDKKSQGKKNKAAGKAFEKKDTSRYSEANRRRWNNPQYKLRVGNLISIGQKGKMPRGENHPMWGKHHSKEAIDKIKNSEYHKNHKGINRGEKHPGWKGNDADYSSIHLWIRDNFGKASFCERCNKENAEWSNKDHKYSRKREDWQMLCRSCHRNYDKGNK